MKILFLALGDETVPSSRTRVFQYLPHLKRNNYICKVVMFTRQDLAGKKIEFFHKIFALCKLLIQSFFYDIIVIQKVMLPGIYLTLLKSYGKKIVFDFDDAIYISPEAGKTEGRERLSRNTINFRKTVQLCDLVVLENNYTKEYVKSIDTNKPVLKITGPIDTERYYPADKAGKDTVVIGWIGSGTTTVYLEPLFSVFRKITEEHPNVRFHIIGAAPLALPDLPVKQIEWNLKTEVRELQEFDIGIMPLLDDEWARGKGGYKLLQYMALGIPSIASPVGINKEMIKEGINGFLARQESEWQEKLLLLIDNAQIRKVMGLNARRTAEEEYSFFAAVPTLIEALESIRHR